MMKLTTVTLAASLLTSAALAQAQGNVIGAGNISCGEWIEDRSEQARTGSSMKTLAAMLWMQGFLTGINAAVSLDKPNAAIKLPDPPTSAFSSTTSAERTLSRTWLALGSRSS